MSHVVRKGKAVFAAVAAGGLLTGTSVAALAQAPDRPAAAETTPARPRLGLTAGVGGIHGWLGAHAEYFFRRGRLSAGGGAGRVSRDVDDGTDERVRTPAFAATVRGYLLAGKHQPFLEGSYSLLRLEWERGGTGAVDLDRYYGPGLAMGYRYTATGGFTVTTALGAGWAVGADRFVDTFHLGLGYTWRR
jgi:hypothetical protein